MQPLVCSASARTLLLLVPLLAALALAGCSDRQRRRTRAALYRTHTYEQAELTPSQVVIDETTLAPGEAATISLDLANTSPTGVSGLRVSVQAWTGPRVTTRTETLLGTTPLDGLEPGQSQRLTFTITAPSAPGTYTARIAATAGGQPVDVSEDRMSPLTLEVR